MAHEAYHLVPINITMTSLLAADDIGQVLMPGSETYVIAGISASCRALISGTATLIAKNGAGSAITSINLTAGAVVAGSLSIASIVGGDKIRLGFTGIGIGLADVVATVWIKMPSTA